MLKFCVFRVLVAVLFAVSMALSQVPASFQPPIVGFLFDSQARGIRPITGILGNSRISAPLTLPFGIDQAAFLPDQKHAVVSSQDLPEVLILDLGTLQSVSVAGASSLVSRIRVSADGSAAALYYEAAKRLVVVTGLPGKPVVLTTVDLSLSDSPLNQFAVASDGTSALLAFSSADQDLLYSWTTSATPKFVGTASRVSDMALFDGNAIVADFGANQILLLGNVRDQASPALIADSAHGVSRPVGISVSAHNEIYIGNGDTGTVLVLDASGHFLRIVSCSCTITTMSSLGSNALRLTDRLDRPIYVLDRERTPGPLLFIPALSGEPLEGAAQ